MPPTRSSIALKALRELGPTALALNGLYRLGLKSGYFRRDAPAHVSQYSLDIEWFSIPSQEGLSQTLGSEGVRFLREEADEVLDGKARLFGGKPVEIKLAFDQPLAHWTAYESGETQIPFAQFPDLPAADIKFIWEPARFGFAFTLGRAYRLTGEEKYAGAFWKYFETFINSNPAFRGPNWMSGQEVALRLVAFSWAAVIFAASPESTRERMASLATSIGTHAARIPATLAYARSQNNNHLLSEAAGLYTAGLVLPSHPQAPKWRKLGVKWLNWCFENQIDTTGEYVQHSSNYQRLMLQVALWVNALDIKNAEGSYIIKDEEIAERPAARLARNDASKKIFSEQSRDNLAGAAQWLLALTDPETGHVANLGANDGAHILPLLCVPFEDFRPTLQAASLAFCGERAFEHGPWDEMALWLLGNAGGIAESEEKKASSFSTIHAQDSWVYLRAAHFSSRPSHADQLHLDLWWRGQNLALDAGTYLYNAPAPWDNALTVARVHNTVTVDGLDQMTRAGKFLYLDWAQARLLGQDGEQVSAQHNGYRRVGVTHRRTVNVIEKGWRVKDDMLATGTATRSYRLHWLLLDWEWSLDPSKTGLELNLATPYGRVVLAITALPADPSPRVTLVRAGQYVYGAGPEDVIRGWASPTYGVKAPALSLAFEVESDSNVSFASEFRFPESGKS